MDWDALPGLKKPPKIRHAAEAAAIVPDRTLGPTFDELLGVSDRDLLLQLYRERKLNRTQLFAGRQWQHYMEESTLQPCVSIDASCPVGKQMWQRDGELTEAQYRAVIMRRIASAALGSGGVKFLDCVLQPDVGRAEAMRMTRMPGDRLSNVMLRLLEGLAIYFKYSTGRSGDGLDAFRQANARMMEYRAGWAASQVGRPFSVPGLIRIEQHADESRQEENGKEHNRSDRYSDMAARLLA